MNILLALVQLITVHTLAGDPVYLNARQIVSLAEPKKSGTLYAEDVRCVVSMSDSKFVSVKETCAQVQGLMEGGN